MKRLLLLLAALASACHDHPHTEHAAEEAQRPALAFAHWTAESELFVELPTLVVGEESPCAAHVTRLSGFQPLEAGSVTVVLVGTSGEERFESKAPSVPGIFRPVALPRKAGKVKLRFEVRGDGFSADHDLGEVTVFENDSLAKKGTPEEAEAPGKIVFLKEQQWPIPFGTAEAAVRPLRRSISAMATLGPRSDGEVVVTAPVAGRLTLNDLTPPRPGQQVAVNDKLAYMAPRLDAADTASLQLAVTSARLQRDLADRERKRMEALKRDGVVSERRLEEAAHNAKSAKAAFYAAQKRFGQFRRIQRAGGRGEGTIQLPSPIAGTITEVLVAPGAFVEAGAALFRVTDVTQLWLDVRVPEIDAGQLTTPTGATFWTSTEHKPLELSEEAFVNRGQRIDPVSRTLSVLFAVDNADARYAVGTSGHANLSLGEPRSVVTVPASAIVDDSGTPVAFVQREGEAFERRVLRLGVSERGFHEVLSGVSAGEHIVTVGAWSVKLAASSGAVPAHGHAH